MQPAAMVMGKQVRREERRRRWNFPSVTIMELAPLPQGRRPQPACSRQGPEGTEADEHRLAIFEQIFFFKKKTLVSPVTVALYLKKKSGLRPRIQKCERDIPYHQQKDILRCRFVSRRPKALFSCRNFFSFDYRSTFVYI
jgi:hypothetical protein